MLRTVYIRTKGSTHISSVAAGGDQNEDLEGLPLTSWYQEVKGSIYDVDKCPHIDGGEHSKPVKIRLQQTVLGT